MHRPIEGLVDLDNQVSEVGETGGPGNSRARDEQYLSTRVSQKKPFGNWRKAGTERNDSLADPCCRHRDAASIRISTSRWTEQRYSTSLPLLSNLHPLRQRTGS